MTKVISNTYSAVHEHLAVITKIFVVGCLFMAFLYGYNMYLVISRTIVAQNIDKQTATLQASVQNLDAQYITLSNNVDPSMAKNYGLHESNVAVYISRTASVGTANAVVTQL